MSEDKFQRQMDFLIEQHARFSEDMTKLKDALLSLVNIVDRHDKQIAALIERGKETDARLNALIGAVEQHIGNNRIHQ